VQTLKAVGQSAEATVALAAHLYQAGTITATQAKAVADFYDTRFRPVYSLAVTAVQANLDTSAPQDLINLAGQLAALLLQYRNHTP
jgi:cyanate lyase